MPHAAPLHVIAILRAQPGAEEELRQLARGLLGPTRAESGCIRYELIADPEDRAELTFVETWESEAHLAAHLKTPHLQHARARYAELLAGELVLRRGFELGA